MPDRFKLTKNAQFYRTDKPVENELISRILETACENMISDEVLIIDKFREEVSVDEPKFSFVYSAKSYPSHRPVYFLDDVFVDVIHAFLLIIEIGDYIAVLKKSTANIFDIMDDDFSLIGSKEFSSIFSDDDVEFQKLALRNMTVSDRAMRSRSYEAADLRGLLSTHSAGRSIPYYFKLRHGASTRSISGTGRVVESSMRTTLEDIAIWVKEQIDFIEAPQNSNFLDAFAQKVELPDVVQSSSPNAILIESGALFERILKDNVPLSYKAKKGKLIRVSERVQKKLEAALERVYEIDSDLGIIDGDGASKIRINKKSLTLQSKTLRTFKIPENGKLLTLQKYITKNGFFSVTFDDPKFMYFMGSCFEDSSGVSEIDSILDILHPHACIAYAQSEKGKFSDRTKNFRKNSVFGAVESIHAKDDYVFCDDLGDEWADHITFNKAESAISFIHSKHGATSTSASNLHDVVGQGIKNLGNMYFDTEKMKAKVEAALINCYAANGVQTQISRMRKGNPKKFEAYLDALLKDYKLNRSCVLCCSFISKSAISKEFKKIKAGQPVRGNVNQLLWIISSFAHAARDMNIRPVIYCVK